MSNEIEQLAVDSLPCPHCAAPLHVGKPCPPDEHEAGECWCGGTGTVFYDMSPPVACPACGCVSVVKVDSDARAYADEVTSEIEQLAQRAVACPAWRDLPGVRRVCGEYAVRMVAGYMHFSSSWFVEGAGMLCDIRDTLPDLSDPATVGCLLALVREAWGDPQACVMKGAFIGWRVYAGLGKPVQDWEPRDHHPTEAAALVAALEAAPC